MRDKVPYGGIEQIRSEEGVKDEMDVVSEDTGSE
jgi:hypothetical protein